jgi:hypothetical protein
MISIVRKTHQYYLIIEIAVLAILSLALCFIFSIEYATTKNDMNITDLENFSLRWVFTLPKKKYTELYIKQTAIITFSSTKDVETWPFTAQIKSRFSDEVIEDTFSKSYLNIKDKNNTPLVFFDKDFFSKENPVIESKFTTRNPLISKISVIFQYFVPNRANILGYLALTLIVVNPKAVLTDVLILLYFVAFSPVTADFAGFSYAVFCGFYVIVMFYHAKMHSVPKSKLTDYLHIFGYVLFVLFITYTIYSTGFSPFQISRAPIVILSGMCTVQIIGLISVSRFNIPIMFDFVGGLCVYIPYVLQVFLPIYYPKVYASSITTLSSSVLGILSVMCSILSESYIYHSDVISEDVMGVIAKEASSSGELVPVEREESLWIGKVRKVNPISIIVVALPFFFSFIILFTQQITTIQPATLQIADEF